MDGRERKSYVKDSEPEHEIIISRAIRKGAKMETAKITFSNGEEITAEVNGNCFIVDEAPEFPDNLEDITIKKDGQEETIEHGRIIECASTDDKYWFTIGEIPEGERVLEEMQANILYIAMMADVDIDQ